MLNTYLEPKYNIDNPATIDIDNDLDSADLP